MRSSRSVLDSVSIRSLGYKDVTQVVQTCLGLGCVFAVAPASGALAGHDAGISKKAIKLKPVAVVKG